MLHDLEKAYLSFFLEFGIIDVAYRRLTAQKKVREQKSGILKK